MQPNRDIHPDFWHLLKYKDQALIDLFIALRKTILDIYPQSNELLYHTHALTAVFSISEKLSDAFCMIPIYTNHLNLGFNKGTLLDDPEKLLTGTGKLIRHIPIIKPEDFKNQEVITLIENAVRFAVSERNKPTVSTGKTISKITA